MSQFELPYPKGMTGKYEKFRGRMYDIVSYSSPTASKDIIPDTPYIVTGSMIDFETGGLDWLTMCMSSFGIVHFVINPLDGSFYMSKAHVALCKRNYALTNGAGDPKASFFNGLTDEILDKDGIEEQAFYWAFREELAWATPSPLVDSKELGQPIRILDPNEKTWAKTYMGRLWAHNADFDWNFFAQLEKRVHHQGDNPVRYPIATMRPYFSEIIHS